MTEEGKQINKSWKAKDAKGVIGLKIMAFKDYKAARLLLNSGQMHQACFFMNTCLEKELKMFLTSTDISIPHTHDTDKLINLISQLDGITWIENLNIEFFKMLSKIYKSRYYEFLQPDYNFVINKNKFLAEFDFVYSLLESKSKIVSSNYKQSIYQQAIDNKDAVIFQNNYILNNISKEEFLMKKEVVYEFRMSKEFMPIEFVYEIPHNTEFDRFDYQGLVQLNNKQFNLSQVPIDNKNGL